MNTLLPSRLLAGTAAVLLCAGCPTPPEEPPLDLEHGDSLLWLARSNTPTFWETTDVEVYKDAIWACTATKSLTVHRFEDGDDVEWTGSVTFPDSHSSFPRCSHLDREGDLLVVTSHQDEVQPTPFLAVVDASDPASPSVVASTSRPGPVEEAAWQGGDIFLAAHEDGVVRYSLDGSSLAEDGELGGLGNVLAIAPHGDGLAAGNAEGQVHLLTADLSLEQTVEVGSPVQSIVDLGDGRLVVALGSEGLALLDVEGGAVTARLETHGTALRVEAMPDLEVLVANWTDVRVYSFARTEPRLVAVDAVFQATDQPRHLAAGTDGSIVAAGEWEGIHTLRYTPGLTAPELTPDVLNVKVPADGEPQSVALPIFNEGLLPLEITEVELSDGWSGDWSSRTIEAGGSAVLNLSHGGATSPSTGEARFVSNDVDEAVAVVGLFVGSSRIFVGDEAAPFAYTGLNTGETHRLSDQYGKVVLLSYFATF